MGSFNFISQIYCKLCVDFFQNRTSFNDNVRITIKLILQSLILWTRKSKKQNKQKNTPKIHSWLVEYCALTSVGNFIDVVQINLFGSEVIVARSNGIVELSVASILCKNDGKIPVLLMLLKESLQFILRIKRTNPCKQIAIKIFILVFNCLETI